MFIDCKPLQQSARNKQVALPNAAYRLQYLWQEYNYFVELVCLRRVAVERTTDSFRNRDGFTLSVVCDASYDCFCARMSSAAIHHASARRASTYKSNEESVVILHRPYLLQYSSSLKFATSPVVLARPTGGAFPSGGLFRVGKSTIPYSRPFNARLAPHKRTQTLTVHLKPTDQNFNHVCQGRHQRFRSYWPHRLPQCVSLQTNGPMGRAC